MKRHILVKGLREWGLPMFLLMTTISIVDQPSHWVLEILFGVPIWTCAGLLFGWATWKYPNWGQSRRHLSSK